MELHRKRFRSEENISNHTIRTTAVLQRRGQKVASLIKFLSTVTAAVLGAHGNTGVTVESELCHAVPGGSAKVALGTAATTLWHHHWHPRHQPHQHCGTNTNSNTTTTTLWYRGVHSRTLFFPLSRRKSGCQKLLCLIHRSLTNNNGNDTINYYLLPVRVSSMVAAAAAFPAVQ